MVKCTIVEVSGNKDHGKDTVSDYLCDNYGFVKFAFGDILKRVCSLIVGDKVTNYYDRDLKERETWLGISRRDLMTYIGSDVMQRNITEKFENVAKTIDDQIWARRLVLNIVDHIFEIERLKLYKNKENEISDVRIVISDERLYAENYIMRLFYKAITDKNDFSKEDISSFDLKFYQRMQNDLKSIREVISSKGLLLFPKGFINSTADSRRFNVLVRDMRKPSPITHPFMDWHSSEKEFLDFKFDEMFNNSKDLDFLFEQIDNFAAKNNIGEINE